MIKHSAIYGSPEGTNKIFFQLEKGEKICLKWTFFLPTLSFTHETKVFSPLNTKKKKKVLITFFSIVFYSPLLKL